jgi:hypothetical protein
MHEHNQEPLTENELSSLLKHWSVAAPPDLERRIMSARANLAQSHDGRRWWRFLVKGSIRLPVPVACCLAILLVALIWHSAVVGVTCSAANNGFQVSARVSAPAAAPSRVMRSAVACPVNSNC